MPGWSRYRRHRGFFFFGILLIIIGVVIGYVIAQNNQPKVSHTVDEIEGLGEFVNESIDARVTTKNYYITLLNTYNMHGNSVDVTWSGGKGTRTLTKIVEDDKLVQLFPGIKGLYATFKVRTTVHQKIGGIICADQIRISYRKAKIILQHWDSSQNKWVVSAETDWINFDTSNKNEWSTIWGAPLHITGEIGPWNYKVILKIQARIYDPHGLCNGAPVYHSGGILLWAVT